MGPALSVAIQQPPPPPRTQPHQALVSYIAYTVPFLLYHAHRMMKSILLDHDEDTDLDWDVIEQGYPGPRTPSTISDNHHEPETATQPQQYDSSEAGSDDDYGGAAQSGLKRKKGGYDSRIEQILYENPDLPILIVDAGKSLESGGKYIVYTIRTGVCLWNLCLKL
jgi:hypothetical protein